MGPPEAGISDRFAIPTGGLSSSNVELLDTDTIYKKKNPLLMLPDLFFYFIRFNAEPTDEFCRRRLANRKPIYLGNCCFFVVQCKEQRT